MISIRKSKKSMTMQGRQKIRGKGWSREAIDPRARRLWWKSDHRVSAGTDCQVRSGCALKLPRARKCCDKDQQHLLLVTPNECFQEDPSQIFTKASRDWALMRSSSVSWTIVTTFTTNSSSRNSRSNRDNLQRVQQDLGHSNLIWILQTEILARETSLPSP